MLPSHRKKALGLLLKARSQTSNEFMLCRDVESLIHASSHSPDEYNDAVLRASFNINTNLNLDDPKVIVHHPDHDLIHGTLLERIEQESETRQKRFHNMLQEKYEALNDTSFEAIVRCRRCGSSEITEEKQTRSADEAASLYCHCATCHNRWVMR